MLCLLYLGLLNGGDALRLLVIALLAAVEIGLVVMPARKSFRRFWAVGPALLAAVGGVLLICLHTVWDGWNAMGPLALVAYELLALALLSPLLGWFWKYK